MEIHTQIYLIQKPLKCSLPGQESTQHGVHLTCPSLATWERYQVDGGSKPEYQLESITFFSGTKAMVLKMVT